KSFSNPHVLKAVDPWRGRARIDGQLRAKDLYEQQSTEKVGQRAGAGARQCRLRVRHRDKALDHSLTRGRIDVDQVRQSSEQRMAGLTLEFEEAAQHGGAVAAAGDADQRETPRDAVLHQVRK